ncbi:hypothetical protein J4Q44_G00298830 [Coregonus suidteri]|uniref:Uncharacterized protein n=1 Tax=Coregonus suidteri TaxID=861788 RepID=A0AAN8L297_9TELE
MRGCYPSVCLWQEKAWFIPSVQLYGLGKGCVCLGSPAPQASLWPREEGRCPLHNPRTLLLCRERHEHHSYGHPDVVELTVHQLINVCVPSYAVQQGLFLKVREVWGVPGELHP